MRPANFVFAMLAIRSAAWLTHATVFSTQISLRVPTLPFARRYPRNVGISRAFSASADRGADAPLPSPRPGALSPDRGAGEYLNAVAPLRRVARLCECTQSPRAIAAVAAPIGMPYFLM